MDQLAVVGRHYERVVSSSSHVYKASITSPDATQLNTLFCWVESSKWSHRLTRLNKTVLSSWVASGDMITLKTQLNKTGDSWRVLIMFCTVGGFVELSRNSDHIAWRDSTQHTVLLSWVVIVITSPDSSRLQQRLSVTVVTQFCVRLGLGLEGSLAINLFKLK